MTYRVLLRESDQGWAVWVPGLPGCASQGASKDEAVANIKVAIVEYMEAVHELQNEDGVLEETVTVDVKVA